MTILLDRIPGRGHKPITANRNYESILVREYGRDFDKPNIGKALLSKLDKRPMFCSA